MAKKRTFACGTNPGYPQRERWAHLDPSGSQSECRIRFVLPARRFSHVLNKNTDETLFSRCPVVAE